MLVNYIIHVPNAVMLSVYSIICMRNSVICFLNAVRLYSHIVLAPVLCYANCRFCCSCFEFYCPFYEFFHLVSNSIIRFSNSIIHFARPGWPGASNAFSNMADSVEGYGIVCEYMGKCDFTATIIKFSKF